MQEPVTRHFTRDVLLVFIALLTMVVGAAAYLSAQAQHDISQKYIDDAAARAAGEFQSMTDAMGRDLTMIRDWGLAGKMTLEDADALNGLLFPLVKRNPILYGISVADTGGESLYLIENGDGWRTSRTGAADTGRRTVRRFWDAEQRLISEEIEPSTYDPRQRPWFFPALSTDGVHWTLPYRFYNRREVCITGSIGFDAPSGGRQVVVPSTSCWTICFARSSKWRQARTAGC